MRKLIIITGDLAAGKSTLAASLSEELQIPFIIKDTLKEIVCDEIGFASREENRVLSIVAVKDMIYFFKQCALVGNDLILEANFRENELQELKSIAEENGYQVLLFVLTGEEDLLYQRFLDRLPHRHIAHKSLNLDWSLERFIKYINELRDINYPIEPHYIDMTDLDEDEVVDETLKIIREYL